VAITTQYSDNNAMTEVSTTDRILSVLLGAGLGGLASMGVLRLFHDWAFRTEFRFWLNETATHSCIVFVLLALWFGTVHPNVRTSSGILNCVAAVMVGGFVAWFIPYGFVLVFTGQAFITSGVTTLVYIVTVSALENR
jgi:hypothetical protein